MILRNAVQVGAAAAVGGGSLVSCAGESPTPSPEPSRGVGRTLLAYFSRPGENYYYGGRRDLDVGNTERLATMISGLIDCDVHRIEAADPHPASYDATVARNSSEQDADARPAMVRPLGSTDGYQTVLLASPIWNVRTPMIMTTFAERHDLTGTTVLPVVTYAVSGLGNVERDYTRACPGARVGAGLAVRGEEVADGSPQVQSWLRQAGLLGT